MSRGRIRGTSAALLGVSLIAAACGGGGGGGDSATNATIDASVKAGVEKALGDGSSTTAATTAPTAPTSMDEWEKLWAQQRAAVVKKIKDGNFGKSADGKTVTGPSGFTMDLSKCPAGWSDTEGVSDSAVKLGLTLAASGSFAEYNYYAKGAATVFEYYAAKAAFTDSNGKNRKIDFQSRDDGYDPAKAIPLVDELLDSEKAFAVWTSGSPQTLKTYGKINDRCVPNPLAITGHAAWGDPVKHPWTTGSPALSYSSEAVLWGSFIEQHLSEFPTDRKIVIASLIINNDFGKLYDQSFRGFLAQSTKLKDRVNYATETIEPQTPTVTDPMTTLASKKPDVFIAMVAATPCTQAVTDAAQNGMHEAVKYLFQPQTCAGTTFVKKEKVGGDGSAAQGWWIVNPGAKDLSDPAFEVDPFIIWAKKTLTDAGVSPGASSLLSGGISLGWSMSQVFMIAGQLAGGLTRSNLILAQRSIDMTHPMFQPGVKFHMDGNKDAYFIEAGGFQQWDSAKQSWVLKSSIVDLDGQSTSCAWDTATSSCK